MIAGGICMGIVASSLAMLPAPRQADAYVLVADEENIAEAIKTAQNTLEMLSNIKEQLQLQIQNITKLPETALQGIQNAQQQTQNAIKDILNINKGVLSQSTSVADYWDKNLGNVDSILNGQAVIVDSYGIREKSMAAQSETNRDAAQQAKHAQEQSLELSKQLEEAVKNSNEAEGEVQVQQAGNAILATMAQAEIIKMNTSAQLAASQITANQAELVRQAAQTRNLKDTASKASEAADRLNSELETDFSDILTYK